MLAALAERDGRGGEGPPPTFTPRGRASVLGFGQHARNPSAGTGGRNGLPMPTVLPPTHR